MGNIPKFNCVSDVRALNYQRLNPYITKLVTISEPQI